MKRAALLILAVAVGGCGSDKAARNGSEGGPEFALKRARKAPQKPVGSEMALDNELGVLDSNDVEQTLEQHFEEIRGCYARAGKAQRYAGGKVLLKFFVAGDGRATDVLVIESTLGNYDAERCVVDVGRRITFDAPSGRKATTFEYPVEFRSTGQMGVLDVDGIKVERDVASFLPQLAACGRLSEQDATGVMYIEPNGFPGSVGLASQAPIDEDTGDCMVQTIHRWRMSASLPGRALRATFAIPSVISAPAPTATATAEPPQPRRAASSASARRRHR